MLTKEQAKLLLELVTAKGVAVPFEFAQLAADTLIALKKLAGADAP